MRAGVQSALWRGPSGERETALVVDDDRMNRSVIAQILSDHCRVLLAKDGLSALDVMAREPVSIVLLDVSMPGVSGYEVLQRMKADVLLRDIPVIFITGMSEDEDEEYGLNLGAVDYVQKPIRPAIVRARVLTQLNLLRQRRVLEDMALRDGLTGVGNRRGFDEAFEHSLRQARRQKTPLALGMFDVDHFKQYNDHYGHGAGDAVLKQVADILQQSMRRAGDVLARYGGEEFVLLLPDCRGMAAIMADACARVEAAAIPHAATLLSQPLVTISGGGVVVLGGDLPPAAEILAKADALLYRAKAQGRNCSLVEGGDPL